MAANNESVPFQESEASAPIFTAGDDAQDRPRENEENGAFGPSSQVSKPPFIGVRHWLMAEKVWEERVAAGKSWIDSSTNHEYDISQFSHFDFQITTANL